MARILIVDDEPLLPKTFQAYLEAEGHLTFLISDPDRAWASCKELTPDLVIVHRASYHSNSGIVQVVPELRRTKRDLCILRVSASGDEDAETRALDEGATYYLRLPADRTTFLNSVNGALAC